MANNTNRNSAAEAEAATRAAREAEEAAAAEATRGGISHTPTTTAEQDDAIAALARAAADGDSARVAALCRDLATDGVWVSGV